METLPDENSPEPQTVDDSKVPPAGNVAEPAAETLDLGREPEALAAVEKLDEDELRLGGLSPDGSPAASSFTVGDFVWVKIKGRPWWPGLVSDPSSATDHAKKAYRKERASVLVAYFGDGTMAWCEPSQLKHFFEQFHKMVYQSNGKSFVRAVEDAVDEIREHLELELACHCMPQEARAKKGGDRIQSLPIENLQPLAFLQRLHAVACDVMEAADVIEITMLKSWVMAFGKGWTDGLPGYHLRHGLTELVDKIDLDVPAGDLGDSKEEEEEEEEAEWIAGIGVRNELNIWADKLYKCKKKSMTALIAEMDLDAVELSNDEDVKSGEKTESLKRKGKNEGEKYSDLDSGGVKAEEEIGSSKRERKKSKYLSPPYTDLDVDIKSMVSPTATSAEVKMPKKSILNSLSMSSESTANLKSTFESIKKEEDKASPLFKIDLISVNEIASELRNTASDLLHLKRDRLAKSVKAFFTLYRSSMYSSGSNFLTYQKNLSESSGKSLNSANEVMTDRSVCGVYKGKEMNGKDVANTENMIGLSPAIKSCSEQSQPRKRKKKIKNEVGSQVLANVDAQIVNVQIESRYEHKNINSKDGFNGESAFVCPEPINYLQPAEEKYQTKEKYKMTKGKVMSNGQKANLLEDSISKHSQDNKSRRKRKKAETVHSFLPLNLNCKVTNRLEKGRSGQKQHENESNHINPGALLLSFKDTPLPSRDELISTFSKYGAVIESETELLEESSCARVVFAKSTDAETAFNSSDKPGVFMPPNTTYHLHYLPQTTSSQPPAMHFSKPLLPCIRENLESMISTLASSSSPSKETGLLDGLKSDARENLVGDMEGLLKKVKRMLNGPAAGTPS